MTRDASLFDQRRRRWPRDNSHTNELCIFLVYPTKCYPSYLSGQAHHYGLTTNQARKQAKPVLCSIVPTKTPFLLHSQESAQPGTACHFYHDPRAMRALIPITDHRPIHQNAIRSMIPNELVLRSDPQSTHQLAVNKSCLVPRPSPIPRPTNNDHRHQHPEL
jgi:hypothetical protein